MKLPAAHQLRAIPFPSAVSHRPSLLAAPSISNIVLENAGNFASGDFDIAFLLSADTDISNADTRIGLNVDASAPAHSRGTFTRTLNIPSNTPPGTYSLGILSRSDRRRQRIPRVQQLRPFAGYDYRVRLM